MNVSLSRQHYRPGLIDTECVRLYPSRIPDRPSEHSRRSLLSQQCPQVQHLILGRLYLELHPLIIETRERHTPTSCQDQLTTFRLDNSAVLYRRRYQHHLATRTGPDVAAVVDDSFSISLEVIPPRHKVRITHLQCRRYQPRNIDHRVRAKHHPVRIESGTPAR